MYGILLNVKSILFPRSYIHNGRRRQEMWHFSPWEIHYIKWDTEQPQKAPVIISFVTVKAIEALGSDI